MQVSYLLKEITQEANEIIIVTRLNIKTVNKHIKS